MPELHIAYDNEASAKAESPFYFVYDIAGPESGKEYPVIYKGTYAQCLCVCGGFSLFPDFTLEELNEKCNGFLFDVVTK